MLCVLAACVREPLAMGYGVFVVCFVTSTERNYAERGSHFFEAASFVTASYLPANTGHQTIGRSASERRRSDECFTQLLNPIFLPTELCGLSASMLLPV